MNSNPIGVFDSGVGGLTVVRAMVDLMPHEKFVYFGDTARVPYGSKSSFSVKQFAKENANFLLQKNVKAMVIACNTATAVALPELQNSISVPVVGVVSPGAGRAVAVSENSKIGVIGTNGTIKSDAYKKAINEIDVNIEVHSLACPLFVPLIEENWLAHEATNLIVREYLDEIVAKGIDTLVLGCTHYPLLSEVIQRLYPHLKLVDSAVSTAVVVKRIMREKEIEAIDKKGAVNIFLSDYSDSFKSLAERILKRDLGKHLEKVNLEEILLNV